MKRLLLFVALALALALPVMAADVPDTIPHPPISSSNGFRVGVARIDPPPLKQFWQAPYLHATPYVENSGWLNGDRIGYSCLYAFLQRGGEIIGRVTFRALDQSAAYMRINDTYMEEPNDPQNTAGGPSRYYDGSINSTGQQAPFGECPKSTESYETANVPDERPKVVFWDGDTAVEVRDYATTEVQSEGVTFDLVAETREPFTISGLPASGSHVVNDRVAVLAREFGVPTVVVYYDGLGRGSMFPTETSNPDNCNAIVSMSQGAQVYGGQGFNPPPSPLEELTGEEWMLLVSSGKMLPWWTTAANWNTLGERHRCGTDAEIDRVLFIFDPALSQDMAGDLDKVLDIIAARYPNAEAQLSLLVGAEGHVVCQIQTQNGLQNVKASQTHASRIDEMTMPEAGPDLDVPCSGYADRIGHLTTAGAATARSQVAAFE